MITQFKIFENENIYNVGNYVKSKNISTSTILLNCFKLTSKQGVGGGFQYNVEFINYNNEIRNSFLFDRQIERRSTPDEIKEFEIAKASIKYNI